MPPKHIESAHNYCGLNDVALILDQWCKNVKHALSAVHTHMDVSVGLMLCAVRPCGTAYGPSRRGGRRRTSSNPPPPPGGVCAHTMFIVQLLVSTWLDSGVIPAIASKESQRKAIIGKPIHRRKEPRPFRLLEWRSVRANSLVVRPADRALHLATKHHDQQPDKRNANAKRRICRRRVSISFPDLTLAAVREGLDLI